MTPQPIYRPNNVEPAYHLRFSWTGWLRSSVPRSIDTVWESLAPLWESDGLRLLESSWQGETVQVCFSAKPQVSPVFIAQRAKGRLQHALRTAGCAVRFSRKVAVRAIGENSTKTVEDYIESQVEKSLYLDERFREFLRKLIVVNRSVDLAQPSKSLSGRYWYNLHVVLTTPQQARIGDRQALVTLRNTLQQIAEKKGCAVSTLSVMPDHVHLALRGSIEKAPEEIALAFLNNTAYALGQKPVWNAGYYAGTFSEYDIGAIRHRVLQQAAK